MTMTHNFLTVTGTKPTAGESTPHEIVINEADGSLWTKNEAGVIIKLGDAGTPPDLSSYETIVKSEADDAATLASANTYTDTEIGLIDLSTYETIVDSDANDATTLASAKTYTDTEIAAIPPTDISGKADTTYVDSENVAQDTIIAGKEDDIPYGASGYLAVANVTSDGFDWIPQTDNEFYRLRGSFVAHAGAIPDAFADTVGDNVIPTLIAGQAPTGVGEPSGVTYRSNVTMTVVIHPLDAAVDITPGDLVFWSGDSSKWLHLEKEDSVSGVDSVNTLTGDVIISGNDGIDVVTGTESAINVDATVSRTGHTHVKADITDFAHTHVESEITDLDKYTKAEVDSITTGGLYNGEPS